MSTISLYVPTAGQDILTLFLNCKMVLFHSKHASVCVCMDMFLIGAVSATSVIKEKKKKKKIQFKKSPDRFFTRIICKLDQILCYKSNDSVHHVLIITMAVISAAVVWTLVNTSDPFVHVSCVCLPRHMSGVSVDAWFVARPADRSTKTFLAFLQAA